METTETTTAVAEASATVNALELARVLNNAALFTNKKADARPTLENVRIEFGADLLKFEATDSYALIAETLAVPSASGSRVVLVNVSELANVAKFAKSQKVGEVKVWAVGDVVSFSGLGWSVDCKDESPNYSWPNTAMLWPRDDQLSGVDAAVGVRVDQIARIAKVVAALGENAKSAAFAFKFQKTPLKPFVVERHDVRILVMPFRLSA